MQLLALTQLRCVRKHLCGGGAHQSQALTLESLVEKYRQDQFQLIR